MIESNTNNIEKYSKFIFLNAPMIMGVVELLEDDIVFLTVNEMCAKFWGGTVESLSNTPAKSLGASSKHVERWLENYKIASQNNSVQTFEYPFRLAPNGKKYWVNSVISPIGKSENGNDLFSFILSDITDKKVAENKLLMQYNFQQKVIEAQEYLIKEEFDMETMLDFIAQTSKNITNADGVIIEFVNDSEIEFKRIMGQGSHLQGEKIPIQNTLTNYCRTTGEIALVHDSEQNPYISTENIKKFGVHSAIVLPLKHEKNVLGMLKIYSDKKYQFNEKDVENLRILGGIFASALFNVKMAEAKAEALHELEAQQFLLDAIITNINVGVIACNAKREVVLANKQASGLFDTLEAFKLDKNKWPEYFTVIPEGETQPLPIHKMPIYRALSGETVDNETFKVSFNSIENAEESYLKMSAKQLFDNKNNIDGAVVMFQDITELKRKENELIFAKEEAEKNASAKSDFLAMMSHEIRTPLNGVIGMAELLNDTTLNDDQKDFVETIQISAENLLYIINNILDYTKIDSGKMELECQETTLDEMAKNIFSMLKPKAQKNNISLNYVIEKNMPASIFCDKMRLTQILINLLNNAVKYTQNGSVSLMVQSEMIDNKAYIVFSVIDTGIGISEDKIDMLFKPFTQLDSSNARKYGGTGLGLAICKRLAELMNGDISVKSTFGKGTSFSLKLPLLSPQQNIITEEITPMDTPELLTEKSKTETLTAQILLVEDNLINQKLSKYIFEKLGFPLAIADNAIMAIEMLKAQDYSLVFMDIQMPEMDGVEATQIIKTNWDSNKCPKIVAMTANAMTGDREKYLAAGMDDYISKPVMVNDIKMMVEKWMV